jgi:hypothetical protein
MVRNLTWKGFASQNNIHHDPTVTNLLRQHYFSGFSSHATTQAKKLVKHFCKKIGEVNLMLTIVLFLLIKITK